VDYQIRLLAETKQATQELASFAKTATTLLAGGAIFVGAIKGAQALASALAEPVQEAIAAEKAIEGLNLALALSGQYSEDASLQFQSLATELQATSLFADEAVLSAAALATNLGATTDQTKQVVRAAADLAAATGTDLNTATEALTKSLQGQGRQLAQLVPQTKGLKEEALKAGAALEFVSQRFSGAAEAAGNTFSGALIQNKNAFSDLLEVIGGFIVNNPIVVLAIKTVTELFAEFTAFLVQNKQAILEFTQRGIVSLVDGLASIVGFISRGIIPAFQTWLEINRAIFNAIINLSRAIGTVLDPVINFLGRGVAAITAGLLELLNLLLKIPGAGRALEGLGVDTKALEKNINGASAAMLNLSSNFDVNNLRDGFQEIGNSVVDVVQGGAGKAGEVVTGIEERLRKFSTKAGSLVGETVKSAAQAIGNSKQVQTAIKTTVEIDFKKLAAGIIGNVQQGAAGVAGAFSAVTSTLVESVLPGLGGAAGSLLGFLAQGPEAVKAQIESFIQNIPVIIQAIVESIPVVFETISEQLPFLIQRLAELAPQIAVQVGLSLAAQMPFVATQLAFNLIAQSPNIAKGFVDSLVKEAGRLITAIADGVKGAISSAVGIGGKGGLVGGLLGGVGGGILGGGIGGIGKKFKFADGGVVPGGAPFTDRVNALLTPGEVVMSRDQVAAAEAEKVNILSAINNLAATIAGGSGQNMTINLSVGEADLAQVILNLNRQGFRLQ